MIGVLFIDLKKAFETINRHKLLQKLESIGIGGTVLMWFESYLSQRKQRVKFGNVMSDERDINFGVPQGSILGPLLFLIYINYVFEIFKDSSIICKLFADDMKLYINGNNIGLIDRILNEALSKLLEWLNENQMKINSDKTVFM
ncbi:GSCOCG00011015001-RA-CDS, partial [Cotesia congregata]